MGEWEWWANVYEYKGGDQQIGELRSLAEIEALAIGRSISRVAYRIHVRLKPEGAPKRYTSEAHRKQWEKLWPVSCPPKIEERT